MIGVNLLFAAALSLGCQQSDIETLCSAYNYRTFFELEEVNQFIDLEYPDNELLDAAIFHATNEQRARKRMKTFSFNEDLRHASYLHNVEMQRYRYLAHKNRRGQTFADRIYAQDRSFIMVGENLATVFPMQIESNQTYYIERKNGKYVFLDRYNREILPETYASLARRVVKDWMESPSHRENVLDPDFRELGCSMVLPKNPYGRTEIQTAYAGQSFGTH